MLVWKLIFTNFDETIFQNVLYNPEVMKLLEEKHKFDVVINSVFVANEMGYYLAHKYQNRFIETYF
jgi:hypothetical protein